VVVFDKNDWKIRNVSETEKEKKKRKKEFLFYFSLEKLK